MLATTILWSHALAALLFAVVAGSQMRRAGDAVPRLAFTAALACTALWALAVAGIGPRELPARLTESLTDLAWLAFMFALARRGRDEGQAIGVTLIYGVVLVITVAASTLDVALAASLAPAPDALVAAVMVMRVMAAMSALVLVHHLHGAVAPRDRHGIRLAVAALALFWGVDLTLYAVAYLSGGWPDSMVAVRGLALVVLAPVFALAVHRNGDWSLQLSRTVAYQSLSLAAVALYVALMTVATGLIAGLGGTEARIVQTAFVFGATAAMLTVIATPWLRAWTRVKLAKHLFRHRYDYRGEWVRFTDTLGRPDGETPLEQRIVKAVADVTDSPAGLLLTPDGAGLGVTGAWNWPGEAVAAGDAALARHLAATGRIVELDHVRAPDGDECERAAIPLWLLDSPEAWALVPLIHFDELAGVIVLARPPLARRLDWEDFDLLKLLGRQAASYLAEAASHAALAEARRFDEFNRRFAFIIHDIKNLVSQLTLVARNAERHADNPAFRADMVATLGDAAERMNALLQRLSQHHRGRAERVAPVDLATLVERLAAARRAQHPVQVVGGCPHALADAARLERVLGHLIQNAIEASAADLPVTVALGEEAGRATIDVIDHGCGMAPAFVRDQLFRPFVSSKPGGFGIGAFEARQLTEAMGGTLSVASREGEGTRFRVALPIAQGDEIGRAA